MAFNYPYPATYQNPYSAPMQYPMHNNPITQPTNSDFIWVQGEAGAKAYPVAPNTTVHLWDSEKQIIYITIKEPGFVRTSLHLMMVQDWRL